MFIVRKNSMGDFDYFIVKVRDTGISYGYINDIEKATKFESKESAEIDLKRSGFLAHSGIDIVRID